MQGALPIRISSVPKAGSSGNRLVVQILPTWLGLDTEIVRG